MLATRTKSRSNEGTDAHATMVKLTSVGRFGKVNEIAAAVAYLASPGASFTNGENLTVDGGWNA
jgi:3-oxoacyl-[acyl-carrier protein] reductase